ncbi:cytochrome C biogenesis protein CcmF [Pseudomonas aeruginosa]|nr:cytochrome C biogenesis protein CcmF [Pseudomonas aeruginosa]
MANRCVGLLAGLLVAGLLWLWPALGNVLLVVPAGLIVLGALCCPVRDWAWRLAAAVLTGACLALTLHLLGDHFQLRYVWLYSSAELPTYLKAANLWGGDEGTVLLLAAFCMAIALRLARLPGWAGPGIALIAAWYSLTAAWMGPFTATPGQWLAMAPSQGMNAHLQTIWMALHAPLILAAYAWVLAPAGAALEALCQQAPGYRELVMRYGQRAWVVLTAGIGIGMLWAFEDFTFGQFWHWDPVQTAVFAVWALLTASLHGLRRWKVGGFLWRSLPTISLASAGMTCLAMAVTRSEVLASSHRYVGTTSWASHGLLAAVLVLLAGWAWWRSYRGASMALSTKGRQDWPLLGAVWLFVGAGVCAAAALAYAHLQQWMQRERPTQLKPFFETLSTWASASEMDGLRRAFAQWDVDGYTLGTGLLPVCVLLGLLGSYGFLKGLTRARVAILLTAVASLACLWSAWAGGSLTHLYNGRGVLSQSVVRVLPWLDAALLAAAFLLLSCVAWSILKAWRTRGLWGRRYAIALGMLHGGGMLALVGSLTATALNTYLPMQLPETVGRDQWQRAADGLQLRVTRLDSRRDAAGYQAVAEVELRRGEHLASGQALFEDARRLPPGYQGPVRQLCELLDYRYARYAGDRRYMLHPFISRGWTEDVQVWVPASSRLLDPDRPAADEQSLLVVRRYPFLSLLWMGLLLMVSGALLLLGSNSPVRGEKKESAR